MKTPTFVKDQNGTVFSDLGQMTAADYREFQAMFFLPVPRYEDLPVWDSTKEPFVKVSGDSDSEPGASPDVMGKGQ